MYLTNNSDFTPENPSAIDAVTMQSAGSVSVYTLSGQLVRRNMQRGKAVQGLPAGIYVVDGEKVIVR